MTDKMKGYRGYSTPVFFRAPGPLSAYTTTGTVSLTPPPPNGGTGVIDCAWLVPTNLCISTLRTFRRVADPTTGSTQVEVWRRRAGAWTCIGNATMTIPFGTDMAQATITPGGPTPVEYRTLYKDDIVVALLVSSEPAASDLTVTIEFR